MRKTVFVGHGVRLQGLFEFWQNSHHGRSYGEKSGLAKNRVASVAESLKVVCCQTGSKLVLGQEWVFNLNYVRQPKLKKNWFFCFPIFLFYSQFFKLVNYYEAVWQICFQTIYIGRPRFIKTALLPSLTGFRKILDKINNDKVSCKNRAFLPGLHKNSKRLANIQLNHVNANQRCHV